MGAQDDERAADRRRALAEGFRAYLIAQTEVELLEPVELPAEQLWVALERLDLALAQVVDLASVYGDDSRFVFEPLIAPTAALTGEYLRQALAGQWLAGDEESITLMLPGNRLLDLLGLVRLRLSGGGASLSSLVRELGDLD